jgi:endonuclease YncB( thermonuclease family)
MRRVIFLAVLLLVIVTRGASAEIVGRASVIDGDTIDIRGERIRLFGIDTPESTQLCSMQGKPYRCGQQAALALADKLGQKTVHCSEKDVDRYGRTVAVCFVAGEDINRWLTSEGWALAYRKYSLDYVDGSAIGFPVWKRPFGLVCRSTLSWPARCGCTLCRHSGLGHFVSW